MFSEILIIDDEFGQLDQGNPKISDEQASISLFFRLLIDGNLASYWDGDINNFDNKFTVELASVQIIILDIFLQGIERSSENKKIIRHHMAVLNKTIKKIDSKDIHIILNTGGDESLSFDLGPYKELLQNTIEGKFLGKTLKVNTLDKKGVLSAEIITHLQSQRLLRLALEKSVLLVIQLEEQLRISCANHPKLKDRNPVSELIDFFSEKITNNDENRTITSCLRGFNEFRNHLAHEKSLALLEERFEKTPIDKHIQDGFLALKPTKNFEFNSIVELHGFLANFIKILDTVKSFETKK